MFDRVMGAPWWVLVLYVLAFIALAGGFLTWLFFRWHARQEAQPRPLRYQPWMEPGGLTQPLCFACGGVGTRYVGHHGAWEVCAECEGRGTRYGFPSSIQRARPCSVCAGEGFAFAEGEVKQCPGCGGRGLVDTYRGNNA
jgi:hypothetical protein